MAIRCSTAFVDPASAMTTVMAFSKASLVMIGARLRRHRRDVPPPRPIARAYASRRESGAGGAADPGNDMPSASAADAIVLAVYMPPQAPSPGQIARSIAATSSVVIFPARHAPTASNASMIVTSRSPRRPGNVEPA